MFGGLLLCCLLRPIVFFVFFYLFFYLFFFYTVDNRKLSDKQRLTCMFVLYVFSRSDHPVVKLLRKHQYRIYNRLYPFVSKGLPQSPALPLRPSHSIHSLNAGRTAAGLAWALLLSCCPGPQILRPFFQCGINLICCDGLFLSQWLWLASMAKTYTKNKTIQLQFFKTWDSVKGL